jgi:hypothetical protein
MQGNIMSARRTNTSDLTSAHWACECCGCEESHTCRIEIIVECPNGKRTMILEGECTRSAANLCIACDERLLPELKSLLEVWRQLGAMAMVYRSEEEPII